MFKTTAHKLCFKTNEAKPSLELTEAEKILKDYFDKEEEFKRNAPLTEAQKLLKDYFDRLKAAALSASEELLSADVVGSAISTSVEPAE